ncbi:hypothetical protein [Sphingomonas sp. TZW2008]|uniref:hypothetical protein n=1 Tax=Sphingomonas sp. TZW2008 TaxID=1917973 RepID=UPI001181A88B|nr:hypothetical protein [Sphingomonas sp. TZW2008]
MTAERQPISLNLNGIPGKSDGYSLARSEIVPDTRHAVAGVNASSDLFGGTRGALGDAVEVMRDACDAVAGGDLSLLSRTLAAEALTLDATFTQMMRRAALNMAQYPDAADRYMRLAMKAQGQVRATVETLARMHQPREQTVRHIHVGPEGQAVFIENMHGGFGNGRFDGQPHATGAGEPSSRAALPSSNPLGSAVPIACDQGTQPVPHARRARKRRAGR